MNEDPPKQRLSILSFATHATRGLLRDPKVRRKVMFTVLAGAVVMIVAGSTVLPYFLDHREHPVLFVLYWVACGWQTLTALLLALFDMLMIRAEARSVQKNMRDELAKTQTEDSQ